MNVIEISKNKWKSSNAMKLVVVVDEWSTEDEDWEGFFLNISIEKFLRNTKTFKKIIFGYNSSYKK